MFNRWAMTVTAIVSMTAMSGQRSLADDLATISGTVRFSNSNPTIQNFLRDSFLPELNGHTVHARGDAGCAETSTNHPATTEFDPACRQTAARGSDSVANVITQTETNYL